MDPLYEHLHDQGDSIQGSGGVTSNFSGVKRFGEEKMVPYQGHPTTADMSQRSRGRNRTLDPLEDLPPELSTFVIAQSLPPQVIDIYYFPSPYPSRLIELTTVSKKWQNFLFSTPVLWSELYIDERQEDLLATLSIFVRLSSNAPVKLFLCNRLTSIDWTELGSILLPAAERVTYLHFVMVDNDAYEWVLDAVSNLLERLCRLPRLKDVGFDTDYGVSVFPFWIKAFGLPSAVNFSGLFQIKLPESCGGGSRFFDVTQYNKLGTLERLVPPSLPNSLLFEYLVDETNIISNGATLLQLESFSERLTGCTCFEQVVHTATFTLHRLQVEVDIFQTEDLLDCLRMFMHLQDLELRIGWEDRKITRDHTPSDIARLDLKKIKLILFGRLEHQDEAQKPLGDLLSALGILYPGVEEVHLWGCAWMSIEASYLQNLRALKTLLLGLKDSTVALPLGSITLQSVQYLEMQGMARLDNLHAPNLLKLELELGAHGTELNDLGPLSPGLRSLALALNDEMKDFDLASLDFPDLRDLYLASRVLRASGGHLSLPNLVSIQVGSPLRTFTDPSSSQLCITLLCYPKQLPSLRELHFANCVEWDVLFLMLKRRNCDRSGVRRIDTVTLPYIPFACHKLLIRLLAGEIVELPSLALLSLEATREVIFDFSVPGCFACMKNMRPGCTAKVVPSKKLDVVSVHTLYPPEDLIPEEAPEEIRDWLSQRRELVERWKASYVEFSLKFVRESTCAAFPYAPL